MRDASISSAEGQQKLLQLLVDATLVADLEKNSLHTPPSKLVRRYLPPGQKSDLFHLYCAHQIAANQPTASITTFYRMFKPWRKCLRMRGKSQHAECSVCQRLPVCVKIEHVS